MSGNPPASLSPPVLPEAHVPEWHQVSGAFLPEFPAAGKPHTLDPPECRWRCGVPTPPLAWSRGRRATGEAQGGDEAEGFCQGK